MMMVRKFRSFAGLKNGWVKSGLLVLLAGIFNLLFLPFIHFHPGQSHAHAGHELEHHHAGHFHSPELESLADLVHVHKHTPGEDADHDHPVGHNHSSPAEESGKALFPFIAAGSKVKTFVLTQVDAVLSAPEPAPGFSNKSIYLNQNLSPPLLYLEIVPPVRGPPSI